MLPPSSTFVVSRRTLFSGGKAVERMQNCFLECRVLHLLFLLLWLLPYCLVRPLALCEVPMTIPESVRGGSAVSPAILSQPPAPHPAAVPFQNSPMFQNSPLNGFCHLVMGPTTSCIHSCWAQHPQRTCRLPILGFSSNRA